MKFQIIEGQNLVCKLQVASRGRGIFLGDSPFKFPATNLLAQLSVCALFTAVLGFFIAPLGECSFIAQILVGVLLGPSVLGSNNNFRKMVFPSDSFYVSDTFAYFGLLLFLFIVGVKTDLKILVKSGKRAVLIGLCTFFLPLILNSLLVLPIRNYFPMDKNISHSLIWIASILSLSSFHVVVCFLSDLNILHTELGRLALSSSMVSGTCSWVWIICIFTGKQGSEAKGHTGMALMSIFIGCLLVLVVHFFRPVMDWMVRQAVHGKGIRESHVFGVFLMILGCSLFGEIIGQHFLFGPMVLGMAVPDGPPLGSALVEKLDCFVTSILLPIYFVVSGSKLDLSLIRAKNVGVVLLFSFLSLVWKVTGTVIPCIVCKMPINDALYLGLIMSTQGIIDLMLMQRAVGLKLIDQESYSIMILSTIISTGIISPIVKALYNPSRRYYTSRGRTIEQSGPNSELNIMACIHQQDDTPSIINLVEASHSTHKSPVCLYVVHLVDLAGRVQPQLVAHTPGNGINNELQLSGRIINAFKLYQQQNISEFELYPFTAISPYAAMHDDVCSLAIEKKISMVIVPFHKHWTIHGLEDETAATATRAVNRNILKKAPCSVGILVGRGAMGTNSLAVSSSTLFAVGVIFLGGPDDREALAYAARMAKHSKISITVVRFVEYEVSQGISRETERDIEVIDMFNATIMKNDRWEIQEEKVSNSVGVASVLRKIENCFDLILVGRRHPSDSPLLLGLIEWNEFPELGAIGDLLASSDSSCGASVLVIQQQSSPVSGGYEGSNNHKYIKEDKFTHVDMPPWNNAKLSPDSNQGKRSEFVMV